LTLYPHADRHDADQVHPGRIDQYLRRRRRLGQLSTHQRLRPHRQRFNNGLPGWANGDFDGGGSVNFDDYVLIDLAFNNQAEPL